METFQPIAAIGLVLGLLAGTLWWLRRRGLAVPLPSRRAAGRRLECVDRLALAPHQILHLVRVGDTALLVASSPSGCTLIRAVPWREVGGPEANR